jgi:hypothetical protein
VHASFVADAGSRHAAEEEQMAKRFVPALAVATLLGLIAGAVWVAVAVTVLAM